jgi:hypothetical protein
MSEKTQTIVKGIKFILQTGLLIISGFLYSCHVDSSTTTYSMSDEDKEQFAEMVAIKVIELQRQKRLQDREESKKTYTTNDEEIELKMVPEHEDILDRRRRERWEGGPFVPNDNWGGSS